MADRSKEQQRNRRRFARRQWARRWLTWRYVAGVLAFVLLIGLGVYAVYFSPWLQVEGVEIVGEGQLAEDDILETANVPTGGALALADLDAIEVRVLSLAAVKSVDVSRHWPHDVRIQVVERTPIAVVARGERFTQLDEEGVTFGNLPQAPPDLPRVVTGPAASNAALAEAASVVASLSRDVSTLVDHVEVLSVDRILLHLRDGRLVRWGSADQSDDKADVLLALLKAEKAGNAPKARVFDVSVPGRPTTRK